MVALFSIIDQKFLTTFHCHRGQEKFKLPFRLVFSVPHPVPQVRRQFSSSHWGQREGPGFTCELLCVLRTLMGLLSSWAPSVSVHCGAGGCSANAGVCVLSVLVSGALTSGYWVLVRHTWRSSGTSWVSPPEHSGAGDSVESWVPPLPPSHLQVTKSLPLCWILLTFWVIYLLFFESLESWSKCEQSPIAFFRPM